MYNIGVFPGKFLPPHRGHLNAILRASTKCEKLYVVVSQGVDSLALCDKAHLPTITIDMSARWLSTELAELDHIKVIMLREDGIPAYPEGWEMWSHKLHDLIPEKIDVIFGGEPEYETGYTKYFPETIYEVYDSDRALYPISATKVRENPYKHWDYILGSARPFFTQRILITGTESCGKTTLTKMLAKVHNTSWAREEGRYYSSKYFGGNEEVFIKEDFFNICWEQRQVEEHAFKTSNKVVFCDTDAVVTQYYCKLYLGQENPLIESFVDSSSYDIVFLMKPDVKWVADGFRFKAEQEERIRLHEELKTMYLKRGFRNIIEVGGTYEERFNFIDNYIRQLMEV